MLLLLFRKLRDELSYILEILYLLAVHFCSTTILLFASLVVSLKTYKGILDFHGALLVWLLLTGKLKLLVRFLILAKEIANFSVKIFQL